MCLPPCPAGLPQWLAAVEAAEAPTYTTAYVKKTTHKLRTFQKELFREKPLNLRCGWFDNTGYE